jgi:hypothetical protein
VCFPYCWRLLTNREKFKMQTLKNCLKYTKLSSKHYTLFNDIFMYFL